MTWVLAVVVVGLIAVLAELLLSYQKRAHDLRARQDPLRRRIRSHGQAMQEAVRGIQATAGEQMSSLEEELRIHTQQGEDLRVVLARMEQYVFGEGYDPDAPVQEEDTTDLIQERTPDGGRVDEETSIQDVLRQARELHRQEVEGHRTSLQRDLDVVRRTLSLLEVKLRRGASAGQKRT